MERSSPLRTVSLSVGSKVFAFQVHSGEFVQIIYVRNSHWCVVSTVGCQSGVVRVYDSLYKTLSEETVRLITSMVHVQSSELKIVMMDVDKQSNGKLGPSTTTEYLPLSVCGVAGVGVLVLFTNTNRDVDITYYTFLPTDTS